MSLKKSLAAFVAALLLSPAALAVVVIQPVPVNTNMGEFPPGFLLDNLADQSGLSAGYDSGVTNYQTYVGSMPTHSLPGSGESWASGPGNQGQPTGFIDFELPEAFALTNIAIWSGSAPALSSLDAFQVFIDGIVVLSSNAVDAVDAVEGSIFLQTFILDPMPATSVVTLQVLSNHGTGANGNGNFTTISEVAFGGTTAAIPEPATVTLVGLFLAGLGFRKIRVS